MPARFGARRIQGRRVLFYDWTGGGMAAGSSITRASTGTRINVSKAMVTETNDVARFTYDPVTGALEGLLNEPSRTNSFVQGTNLSASWLATSGPVVATVNQTTSPTGSVDASKIKENSTANNDYAFAQVVGNASNSALSGYFKAAERQAVALFSEGAANALATMDLSNGTLFALSGSAATKQASIKNAGNGLYRLMLGSSNPNNGSGTGFGFSQSPGVSPYVGIVGDGIYAYGLQYEIGALDASSFIPTTTAAVTRAADVVILKRPSGTLIPNGIYSARIERLSGGVTLPGQSITDGTYTVPTDTSPLRTVALRRTG